jgi:hypothetical protein
VLPHLGSSNVPSHPTLRLKYVELMGKVKGYNSNHVYCQLKDGPKRVKKIFSMIWKRFLN